MGAQCCCLSAAHQWQHTLDNLVTQAVTEWASPCAYKRFQMNARWSRIAAHLKTYDITVAPHASLAALCDIMYRTLAAPVWMSKEFASGILLVLDTANDAFAFHGTNSALLKAVATRALVVYKTFGYSNQIPASLRAQYIHVSTVYALYE